MFRELNMLKEIECFYFTEEWAFDATLTGCLQRKLMRQTLLCGCCYEFHYICEENKRRKNYQSNLKLDYTDIKSIN